MPAVATPGMSAPGLPALVAFGPHAAPSCTTRWYRPDLMPSNQPVDPTVTGLPSTWANLTVAPLSLAPLTGDSSACARFTGGGGGGSGAGSGLGSGAGAGSGSGFFGGAGSDFLPPHAATARTEIRIVVCFMILPFVAGGAAWTGRRDCMRWVDRDVLSGRAARSAAGRVHPRHGPRSQAITVTYATRWTAGT